MATTGRPKGSKNAEIDISSLNTDGMNRGAKAELTAKKPLGTRITAPAGKAQTAIQHLQRCIDIGKGANTKDINDLLSRFEAYVNMCIEYDRPIMNQQAYLSMGVSKQLIYAWECGKAGTPEHQRLAQFVQQVCACYREEAMATGAIDRVVGIFWQKNFDGYKDFSEVQINPIEDDTTQATAEEIARRYITAPEED